MHFKTNQTGRSMLEMLVVLAIVGVLSIVAVAGLTYAMNKHRANATIYDVLSYATLILTGEIFEKTDIGSVLKTPETEQIQKTSMGYFIDSIKETEDIFSVHIESVPEKVCTLILKGPNPSDTVIGVNNSGWEDLEKTMSCDLENSMNFYFNATGRHLCNGMLCRSDEICQNETCVCPPNQHEEEGTCVCDSGMEVCQYGCYEACVGDFISRNEQTCECECDTSLGFNRVPKDDVCVCPPDMMFLNGRCRSFNCYGGTVGAGNWTCTIDGKRCGSNCSQDGLTCYYGLCNNVCPSGTTFDYQSAIQYYGCKKENAFENTTVLCTKITTFDNYYCYVNDTNVRCGNYCSLDGTNCYYGVCDQECMNKGMPTVRASGIYGCLDETTGVVCGHNTFTTYGCYKNDAQCGIGCQDSFADTCTTNMCFEDICPTGTVFSVENNQYRCTRPDGIYCALSGGGGVRCYTSDDKTCGIFCELDGINCRLGTCDSSICDGLSGYVYKLNDYGGGCYHLATNVLCINSNPSKTTFTCYYDGAICGQMCTDYGASGCPACTQGVDCPAGSVKSSNTSGGYYRCIYPTGLSCNLTFSEETTCFINELTCGTKCSMDGTACAAGVCTPDTCDSGEELVYDSVQNLFKCSVSDKKLSCTAGSCQIGQTSCGTGCDEDGTNCRYGICAQSECIGSDGTIYGFGQVTHMYYGCIHPDGIKCYREGDFYTCLKNSVECGTGCSIDAVGGTCDTGCL